MTCEKPGRIEEEVLRIIRPGRLQRRLLGRLLRVIADTLTRCPALRGYDFRVEAVGSYAKDTMLFDKWEIDVFVIFSSVGREWINRESERVMASCLRGKLPIVRKYAQHPYITVSLMGLEADVVPIAEASDHAFTGVERTPHHTRYVLSRLKPCQRDEVRLLKSFMKGIGVYGAETARAGFSGYLAELLVITYGSFHRVLQAASEWRPVIYIDPENSGDKERLLRKYRDSRIIVVDPVDPERNAAAAVGPQSLATMILASKLYLEKPSRSFFHVFSRPSERRAPLYLARIRCTGEYTNKPPDSVWGRVSRLARRMKRIREDKGFMVGAIHYWTDEARNAVVEATVESPRLPNYTIVRGPVTWRALDGAIEFVRARISEGGLAWIGMDGAVYGVRPRRVRSVEEALGEWVATGAGQLLWNSKCTLEVNPCSTREDVVGACTPMPSWLEESLLGEWNG